MRINYFDPMIAKTCISKFKTTNKKLTGFYLFYFEIFKVKVKKM
jgi:hypothetical protein